LSGWQKKVTEEHEVSDLRHSSKIIGKLYPVLLDADGNIIDGQHRLAADSDWPAVRLFRIRSERERLLARLISNACRRTMSAKEKREMLERLGEIYIAEGERRGRLAYRIAEETGMTYRWVMKYLPQDMKGRPGLGGPSDRSWLDKGKANVDVCKLERRSTGDFLRLFSVSSERVVVVRTYVNADFVNLTLEKKFYDNLEKLADRLGIATETMINNAMIMMLKEIEKTVTMMNNVSLKECS
jgi:hypothetical protein